MYATLRENDLIFITDFPAYERSMKASLAVTKMTGISFTTSPALTVEEFDKLTADM